MDVTVSNSLSAKDLNRFTQVALALAEAGGQVLKKFWGNVPQISEKQVPGDLVTEADRQSEQAILAILKTECPLHGILAEESGANDANASDFLWIIDPLDGTTNYAHQYPVFSVSIALLYRNQLQVAVVYNPVQNELFQASAGLGALLNGKPIRVSKVNTISKSLLATGFAYDRATREDNNYAQFCRLTDVSHGVRRPGSAALDLAYVGAGRFDGYWENGIASWDIAAGVLIVQEAGGRVSGYDGGPVDLFSKKVVASNGIIHDELLEQL